MKTDKLPAHASVVVIGGGIMGCSVLYHLTKENVADAILLERHQLTAGTTWHSAAQVRALRSTQNLTDLIVESLGDPSPFPVYIQHVDVHLIPDLEHLTGVVHPAPAQFRDVDQPIGSTQIHESAEIGDAGHLSVLYVSLI